MTAPATSAVQPIPHNMHTVTPHIVCAGAGEAIDWYVRALGAQELSRMPGPNGKLMHGSVRIGDSTVMLTDEEPAWRSLGPKALGGSPVTLHMYVEDTDATFKRAVDAGANPMMEPADMFWGDRYGVIIDPWGHKWAIATHMHDYSPEEMQAKMGEMMSANCPEGSAP